MSYSVGRIVHFVKLSVNIVVAVEGARPPLR